MNKRKCCILNCLSTDTPGKKITFYSFPEMNTPEFLAWVKSAGSQIMYGHFSRKRFFVCALHFDKDCFAQSDITILRDGQEVTFPRTVRRLKKGAIPTIFQTNPITPAAYQPKAFKPFCVAKFCPGKNSENVKLFSIPCTDVEAWCRNLKISQKDLNICSRVCNRHFEKSCFSDISYLDGWQKLRKGARPTLNLGHTDSTISPTFVKNLNLQRRICCIAHCKSENPPDTLFCFPKNIIRLREWISACNFKAGLKFVKHKFICEKHFHPIMVNRNDNRVSLLPNATPIMYTQQNSNQLLLKDVPTNPNPLGSIFSIENLNPSLAVYEINQIDMTELVQNEIKTEPNEMELDQHENNSNVLYPQIELTEKCTHIEVIKPEICSETILPDLPNTENFKLVKTEAIDLDTISLSSIECNDDSTSMEIKSFTNLTERESTPETYSSTSLNNCSNCVKLLDECKSHRERCFKLQKELEKAQHELATLKEHFESQVRAERAKNKVLIEQEDLMALKNKN